MRNLLCCFLARCRWCGELGSADFQAWVEQSIVVSREYLNINNNGALQFVLVAVVECRQPCAKPLMSRWDRIPSHRSWSPLLTHPRAPHQSLDQCHHTRFLLRASLRCFRSEHRDFGSSSLIQESSILDLSSWMSIRMTSLTSPPDLRSHCSASLTRSASCCENPTSKMMLDSMSEFLSSNSILTTGYFAASSCSDPYRTSL